jgi:outer membrane protein assembly factor BamB
MSRIPIPSPAFALWLTVTGLFCGGCSEDPVPPSASAEPPAPGPAVPPAVKPAAAPEPGAGKPEDRPAPAGLVVGDWPCFRGPEHNSLSRETGLLTTWGGKGPPLLWKISSGPTYAAPTVVGERLIMFHRLDGDNGDDREVVDCLDAGTGRALWRHSYPTKYVDKYGYNGGPRASPVVEAGRVYTWGAEGWFHCLELDTGKVVWDRRLNAEFDVEQNFFGVGASPLIEGDRILLNVGGPKGAGVMALDKKTGKTVWKATDDGASYCTAAVADTPAGRLAVFLTRAGVVACDPATGAVKISYPFRSRTYESVNAADPVIVGDRLFVSSAYRTGGVLLKITADPDVTEIWKNDNMRNHWATCLVADGCLYGFDGRHEDETQLRCVELATGKVLWSKRGLGRGSMIRADGRYWILSEDGRLILAELSPKEYVEKAASDELLRAPCWIAPVLSRGRLYVRNEHTLLCLDVRDPAKR